MKKDEIYSSLVKAKKEYLNLRFIDAADNLPSKHKIKMAKKQIAKLMLSLKNENIKVNNA